MKTRILIVDDEVDALDLMEELFTTNGYEVFKACNGVEGLKQIREHTPDIMISDMVMPEMGGMELLEIVRDKYPDIAIIMITAHGTIETAVEAMKKGAKDYIMKPLRLDEILSKVESTAQLKSLIRENEYLRDKLVQKYNYDNIIGQDAKMLELFELIDMVAGTSSTILVRGENGTGKELIANAIHFHSDRLKKPFIKVNCGVLAENLLESELFGHVKGAFTGAVKDKPGRFEMADGGTIFLDEIGDISANMQIKLLRVLQEREFERVGGTDTLKVDVRIIAATNRNLEAAIQDNSFRQDLFYRLNVIPVHVPPLRERTRDIPMLVSHFIDHFSKKFSKPIINIDEEAMARMKAYEWPGNIRELENIIERAIILTKNEVLRVEDFDATIMSSDPAANGVAIKTDRPLGETLGEIEQQIILAALKENAGNKLRTAEQLGIHRSTFMSKVKKYGID